MRTCARGKCRCVTALGAAKCASQSLMSGGRGVEAGLPALFSVPKKSINYLEIYCNVDIITCKLLTIEQKSKERGQSGVFKI